MPFAATLPGSVVQAEVVGLVDSCNRWWFGSAEDLTQAQTRPPLRVHRPPDRCLTPLDVLGEIRTQLRTESDGV
jgi:hypothetical protein